MICFSFNRTASSTEGAKVIVAGLNDRYATVGDVVGLRICRASQTDRDWEFLLVRRSPRDFGMQHLKTWRYYVFGLILIRSEISMSFIPAWLIT